MVTIYDIAKITGCSVATVSRTLSGACSVSSDTRERIMMAAELTGYVPQEGESIHLNKQGNLIGVIVENESFTNGLEHPLFGGILNSFREQIAKDGYDLLYLSKSLNYGLSYLDQVKLHNVQGLLILNTNVQDPEVEQLVKSGIPCVSSSEFIPGVSTVVSENTMSSRSAVEYLISRGHKKIGYIGGPFTIRSPASIERCEGYKQALKSAGLKVDNDRIEKAEFWELSSGYKAAQLLFERCPDLTAVFCGCDTIAAGCMQYLQRSGKSIPGDVSIIGFDDSLISACSMPPITTYRQNREKIAMACREKLKERMEGRPGYEIMRIPVDFLERESVRSLDS